MATLDVGKLYLIRNLSFNTIKYKLDCIQVALQGKLICHRADSFCL